MKEAIICFFAVLSLSEQCRRIRFINKCPQTIWISPLTNAQGPMIPGGIVKIGTNADYSYQISDDGWAGRFWPKQGCDGNGQNCQVGQSIPPCGPTGCDPPAETKVEFYFPPTNQDGRVWYDISLVDGYSLPVEIVPSHQEGSCRTTDCNLRLDSCPSNEDFVGDLRVFKNGRPTMCLSPCKRWNYPYPFGLGQNEQNYPGNYLCCPTPPIYPDQCRAGPVVQTKYVKLVHRDCPSAYSYAYDDEAGLHNCPRDTSFDITFCHI